MLSRRPVHVFAESGKPAAKPPAAPVTSSSKSRRGMIAGIALLGTASVPNMAKAETFLKSVGVRGLAEEKEEELFRLRQKEEGEALKALNAKKEMLEREAATTQNGKLCATPFGVDVVGITELVALIGATVGGIAARQRKDEVERLNEQLRKINMSLRQQARAGTVYAPGLTYAPPNLSVAAAASLAAPTMVRPPVTASPAEPQADSAMVSTYLSMDEDELTTDQKECREALKAGKRLLKEKNGAAALVRFEKALMLSKASGNKVQERRAVRGLAAASRLQGQYKSAINYLERVLTISAEMKEFTGDADAYGTIADCYTDLGNFEKAAQMYDKYIELMNGDAPSRL